MRYVDPSNEHNLVRVMPGNPNSPNPSQQAPYVIRLKNGKASDQFGSFVTPDAPEAHIPLEKFIFND